MFCSNLFFFSVPEYDSQKTDKVSSILPNSTIQNDNNSTVQMYPRFYHLNKNIKWQEKGIEIRQQQKGPCSCFELNCGCCAGMQFRRFKRKRKYSTKNLCNFVKKSAQLDLQPIYFCSLFQFHIRSE